MKQRVRIWESPNTYLQRENPLPRAYPWRAFAQCVGHGNARGFRLFAGGGGSVDAELGETRETGGGRLRWSLS